MSGFVGMPELAGQVAPFRYGLVLVALLWALAVARASRFTALLTGLLFAVAAVGFWVLSQGRPYGLFEDPAATRRLAEVSVAAASGNARDSLAVGEPAAFPFFVSLLRLGIPPAVLQALPSLLPAVSVPAIGLLVFALWARRADALAGACLWLAFPTGELESARGLGLVPGAWARPEAALALPLLAAAALLAGRLPARLVAGAAAVLAAAPLAIPAAGASPALGDALLALTLDQGPWLALGALGLLRARDAVGLGLVAGGATGVLASALLGSADGWASLGLFRLGLLLSAAAASSYWLEPLGKWAGPRLPPRASAEHDLGAARLGLGLVLALALPGSFLAWWDPLRTDPVARAGAEPISAALLPPMAFVARETPKDAVFLASADYAPAVAVLGGRRVLRAPSVLRTADDLRRQRAEGAILAGRPVPPGGSDHGVRFVLLAPGDFRARGVERPEDLEGRPGLRLRYADAARFRVYEVVR